MANSHEFAHSMNSILEIKELQAFDKMSKEIVRKAAQFNAESMEEVSNEGKEIVQNLIAKVMRYNILGGKMLRGLMVPMTYKSLMKNDMSPDRMRLAYALGWILELLQAASLVADDIMDHSETRRGKPCWYRQPTVQLTAVNDSSVLEMIAYQILKIYFEEMPCYKDLYMMLHSIISHTIFGQSLDCHTEKCEDILECFTMERYETIVKYKTSYYTIFMPVICGMILAGKANDSELVEQVESILLQIGHYFQVQDDYLDCFGDEGKTGKAGTDIQDCKCSWLFVKAVQMCDSEQIEILKENYGKDDLVRVGNVKKLYKDLGVKQAYQEYEDESYLEIVRKVANLPEDMPRDVFNELLRKLYKRSF